MTWRARLLILGSLAAVAAGWLLRWPAFVGLGLAGIVTAVAVVVWFGTSPQGSMVVEPAPELVPRGSEATVPVVVAWTSPPRRPWASCALPGSEGERVWMPVSRGSSRTPWPIDSSVRGQFSVGPTDLAYADPFGLVTCRVGEAEPSLTTVTPRLVPIAPPPRRVNTGEDMEGVRVGHENFHTLREYVFGDEPRKIHWRSSARAQKLLVRVSVDAAEEQTLVVLDVDAEAYRRPGAMSGVVDRDLFERAVDTAHSLALAAAGPGRVCHVTTTRVGARPVTVDAHHRAPGALMLAHVEPLLKEADGRDAAVLLKRTAVREVVVVTGRPQPSLLSAMTGWRRMAQDVRLVTVVAEEPVA